MDSGSFIKQTSLRTSHRLVKQFSLRSTPRVVESENFLTKSHLTSVQLLH